MMVVIIGMMKYPPILASAIKIHAAIITCTLSKSTPWYMMKYPPIIGLCNQTSRGQNHLQLV
jgi:hypothetical protein